VAETLFIRLGSQAHHTIHWLIASGSNNDGTFEIIGSGELVHADQLGALTEKAAQRPVIVIVPNSDVLLKRLTVPAKSNRAMRLAVPYMLEDELAQDVEQLFFAYAELKKDQDNNNCFTAIVEHKQMQLWSGWLSAVGIQCQRFIPEVLTLPNVVNEWCAIAVGAGEEEQIIVRQDDWQGFTLDLVTWQLKCQAILLEQHAGINRASEHFTPIKINSYSPLPFTEQLNITQLPEELPLALMAKSYQQSEYFNLLQAEYKVKDSDVKIIKQWFWVAAIALFALGLNFSFKALQLWQINAEKEQVEAQIISQYKKVFPQTKRVRISTIRSQLKQKLAQLGGSAHRAGFLAMLTKVTPAFTKVPELKPESLKFDNKRQELRIQAIADNYQIFEQFKMALESEGLAVKQGAQNNQGSQVTGSFSIKINDHNKQAQNSRRKQIDGGMS